jgi:hypothetical protein
MANEDFQIEFTFQNNPYIGLVKPLKRNNELWYSIDLESQNQESKMQIIARPSTSALEDWDFECVGGEPATAHYDKELLQEAGEAIEQYLIAGSDADRVEQKDI